MTPKEVGEGFLADAYAYAAAVASGEIVTGKYVKLAIARFNRDIENGHKRGLFFNEQEAARALGIFAFLKHSKGEQFIGKPVLLEPWQSFIIACVFGWYWIETGLRRFKYIYEEEARKNGKTTKLSGIGIKGLTKDDQGSPEVYSAATKKDQARLLFDEAVRMVAQSPALRRRLRVATNSLSFPGNGGTFVPLSSDASTQDGLNPSMALIDELHAHKTSEVWDVIVSGLASRLQPILWAITTAGFNQAGVCYEKRGYTIDVLQGEDDFDDSWFGIIYTIDEDDDPFDESCWIKANPNLGVSVSLDYLRDQAKQARSMPTAMLNFLTKNLCRWVTGEVLWCNVEKWKLCGLAYTFDEFVEWCNDNGATVYGGLDLATNEDLAAYGLVGVSADRTHWRCWVFSYLPEDTARDRVQKKSVPYMRWAAEGWLTLTPGATCDYAWIKADIFTTFERLNIECIHYDRWNSSQLVVELTEEGLPMVGFGQGFVSMNAPMKELERRYLRGEMHHPENPLLTWCMGNVVARNDPAGNVKPDKDKSKEKIDPPVALIMAVGAALVVTEIEPTPGVVAL